MATQPNEPRLAQWRGTLETVATLLFIAVCVAVLWNLLAQKRGPKLAPVVSATEARRPAAPPIPGEPIALGGSWLLGRPDASVVLIEYSDFQCPYCARFVQAVLPTLHQRYLRTGRVMLAFRHLPLAIHAQAHKAAEAAECAGSQGRFWEMHDELFRIQKTLSADALQDAAARVKLELPAFRLCMDGKTTAKVASDAASAKTFGVSGTPTFFIGLAVGDGRVKVVERLSGAQPFPAFESALERALKSVPQ